MTDFSRLAALKLHSLASADRRWVLARLERDDRLRLSALLDELRSLGFPRAAGDALDHAEGAGERDEAAGRNGNGAAHIDAWDGGALSEPKRVLAERHLRAEPRWVAEAIAEELPWVENLLELEPALEADDAVRPTAHTRSALAHAFLAELRDAARRELPPYEVMPDLPARGWSGVVSRLQRWMS